MILFAISLILLILFMGVGCPAGFAFGGVVLVMIFARGYDPQFLMSFSFSKISAIALMALPLFILAGNFMLETKISDHLLDWVSSIVSRVRGGLGAVVVITMGIFGAISGIASSAIAAIGPIVIPRLKAEGYPEGYAVSLTTMASALALLIPPSGTMIIYGWLMGQSITACFLATVGPGIVLAIFLIIINYIWVGRMPKVKKREWPGIKEFRKEVTKTTWVGIPAILMPCVILGTIYGGVATPTEAAALAALYCIPVGFIYRSLSLRKIFSASANGAVITGSIMIMFFFATMLCRMFTMENIPQQFVAFVSSISENKYVILLMINIFLIFIGMIMDDASAILITAPMLLPLMTKIGCSPIHLAAIMGINLAMGCMTPPVAPLLYLGMRVGETTFVKMIGPSMVFILFAFMPTVLITTYWEPLSLWLPKVILGAKVLGM